MKILTLKITNLNSLVGSWTIDFTAPDFQESRIFGIFGPTGAGKSTIIDAVCLALYGRTPRQAIVSSSVNNLFPAGVKHSAVELTFSIGSRNFLVIWSQSVSKSNKLQPQKRVIKEINGEIYEEKIRDVQIIIEEITGLDFERFTRSVLLAQGKFDSLLKEKGDERAKILETITGMKIYSEISILVYKQYVQRKGELVALTSRLENTNGLSEEQQQKAQVNLIELESKLAGIKDSTEQLNQERDLLQQIVEQQKNLNKYQQELAVNQQYFDLHKQQITDYVLYQEHRDLIVNWQQLENLQQQLEQRLQVKDEKQQQLDKFNQNVEREVVYLEQLREIYSKQELNYQQQLTNYMDAVGIDSQINLINDYCQKLRAELRENSLQQAKIKDQIIPVIQDQLAQLEQNNKLIRKVNPIDLFKLKEENNELIRAIEQQYKYLTYKSELDQQNKLIKQQEDLFTEQIKLQQIEKQLNVKYHLSLIDYQQMLSSEYQQLQITFKLLNDFSIHLKDGDPCPLCGSLDHPKQNLNLAEQQQLMQEVGQQLALLEPDLHQLEQTRVKLKNLEQKINDSKIGLAIQQDKIEQLEQEIANYVIVESSQLDHHWQLLLNRLNELELFNDDGLITQLQAIKEITEATIPLLKNLERAIKNLEKKVNLNDYQQITQQLTTLQNELQEAQNQLKNKEEQFFKLNEDLQSLKLKQQDQQQQKEKLIGKLTTSSYKQQIDFELTKIKQQYQEQDQKVLLLQENSTYLVKNIISIDDEIELHHHNLRLTQKIFNESLEQQKIILAEIKRLSAVGNKINDYAILYKNYQERQTNLNSLINEYQYQISQLKSKAKLEDLDLSQLNKRISIINKQQEDLHQQNLIYSKQLWEIQQLLNHHQDSLKAKQEIKQQIKQQQKLVAINELMNKLIGSSDGKSFRLFAQSLTFAFLIESANYQLNKLEDRYLIKQDHEKPLEILVEDRYSGSTRSVTNLSGGETFLISLSLALGLANLTSQHNPVECLFLDEGFGTLDENLLPTAIDTLKSLQQDGKMIGVISHIPYLKQVIDCQIEVIPQENGKSIIQGPGVVQHN